MVEKSGPWSRLIWSLILVHHLFAWESYFTSLGLSFPDLKNGSNSSNLPAGLSEY